LIDIVPRFIRLIFISSIPAFHWFCKSAMRLTWNELAQVSHKDPFTVSVS